MACVENIDTNFGLLLEKLKELGHCRQHAGHLPGHRQWWLRGPPARFSMPACGAEKAQCVGRSHTIALLRPLAWRDQGDTICAALARPSTFSRPSPKSPGRGCPTGRRNKWKAAACGRCSESARPWADRYLVPSGPMGAGTPPKKFGVCSIRNTRYSLVHVEGRNVRPPGGSGQNHDMPPGIPMSLNSCPPPTTSGGAMSCRAWKTKRRTQPLPRSIPSRNSTGNNLAVGPDPESPRARSSLQGKPR